MADKYVAGLSEMSMDSFVTDFQEKRTLYWLRKVKAEKMEELLKNMRPVAAPRSPRTSRQPNPPYVAAMPGGPRPNPAQSLPPPHHMPYPPDPRRPSNPGVSMPPYHQGGPQMPMPQGHPFPAAAFSSYYRPPAAQPPYQPRGGTPPRPAPYGRYPASSYR